MDSTNTAPTTATYGHAGTIGGTANILNSWIWSSDEAAASVATSDELECLIPLNIIYDWIPPLSDIQPLTLRQNSDEHDLQRLRRCWPAAQLHRFHEGIMCRR
jgi:hypothetical protein